MINAASKNEQVWQYVQDGDVQAFEAVVRDYQNAVASVAFAGTGDVAGSEDIAQETFLVAWQSRGELRESSRLGGWLCGIARNLAKQWNRKRGAKKYATADGELANRAIDAGPSPIQRVISAEEQRTVWNSLEKIPENYREVLVLFYRQSQSVAQVATTLEISEENVRQRLSRGRNLLRAEVARTVEQTLEHSQPGPQFTAVVMASLGSISTFAKSAGGAAAGSLAAKAVGSAVGSAAGKVALGSAAAGIAGGTLGAAGGLGGAWLGTWLPAQLAPTMTERRLLEQNGRKLMNVSILFLVAIVAGMICFLIPGWWLVGVILQVAMSIAFTVIVTVSSIRVNSEIRKFRMSIKPEDDPNPSWVREKFGMGINTAPLRWVGRRGTSSIRLLGWPLWDFQVADPVAFQPDTKPQARHARGWIAIGDRATGFIAIGGRAIGVFAFGGLSIGVISLGGLSIGLALAIGGGAVGYQAIGGGAVGYNAIGGGAIGYHAAGGGAIAVHTAVGGLAISGDKAVGGMAIGRNKSLGGREMGIEANRTAANEIVKSVPLASYMIPEIGQRPNTGGWKFLVGVVLISVVLPIVMTRLCYRRRRPNDPVDDE